MTRKLYPATHWARDGDHERALARYLALADAPYNRTKATLIQRLLGEDLRGVTVLDYGGGAGGMAIWCAERGARVTLVDAEAQALGTAELYALRRGVLGRVELIFAETYPDALRERRFDVVIAKDVLEHLDDDVGLLAALAGSQSPGGRLIVSTQNRSSLNYLIEGTYHRWWCGERDWCGWDPTHVRFYTPRSLARLLRATGYAPRRWRSVYVVPYDVLTWLTLLRRRIVLAGLRGFDLRFGGVPPFSRLGWNVIVLAERRAPLEGR